MIYHGDCRDYALPVRFGEAVMMTDPPYGAGFAAQPTKWQRRAGHKPADWDSQICDELMDVVASVRSACVWGGNYYPLPPSRGWLVWMKPDAPPSMASLEMAWTSLDQNARYLIHTVAMTRDHDDRTLHPTQKPLRVMEWALSLMPEGIVIDPFMGSGTTLIAAKNAGRAAVGIEIEERYCEIAAKRLRQRVLPLEMADGR